MTCLELMYGMMLPSGNDSAWALAESFGLLLNLGEAETMQRMSKEIIDVESNHSAKESQNNFIDEMNKQCSLFSLNDTHYANPHGLPNQYNVSTAYDQAKLCRIAMEDDLFRQIVNTQTFSTKIFNDQNDQFSRTQLWTNTNRLLADNCLVNGIKTGSTNSAGGCLATSYSIPNKNYQSIFEKKVFHHYFIVTLGS